MAAQTGSQETADSRDDGTNDLLVSSVLSTYEFQVWFLAEHLIDLPLVVEESKWPA